MACQQRLTQSSVQLVALLLTCVSSIPLNEFYGYPFNDGDRVILESNAPYSVLMSYEVKFLGLTNHEDRIRVRIEP